MIITISRQAASNGTLIGHLVADRLNLRFFDRELLEEVARRLQVDPNIVTQFDESALNPVGSLLWEWRSTVNEQIYARYLREALRRILAEDHAVIIGRGANFVLRCPQCLHVRIIAPLDLRVAIFRATHEISEKEALRIIRQEDRGRAQFIRKYYGHDIDDPEFYDLVVNLAGIAPDAAADYIVYAAQRLRSEPLAMEPQATLPQHIEMITRRHRPVRPWVIERQYRIR